MSYSSVLEDWPHSCHCLLCSAGKLLTQSPRERVSPCSLFDTVSVSHRQKKKDKVSLILVKSYINNQKAHCLCQSQSKWSHSSVHSEETLGLKATQTKPAEYKLGGSC